MTAIVTPIAIIALAIASWFVARARARLLNTGRGSLRAVPGYHGWHLMLWVVAPGLLAWTLWTVAQPALVDS